MDEKSSYLTTFNMHHGRYRFLHVPFGWKMSQGDFQMQMDQATDHLPSIVTIHDDICVYSHTAEEHDSHLLQLMQTAKEHGIIFNSTKCQISQPQIAFYGAVFIAQDTWPDPSKIQALQDLPTPDSQVNLVYPLKQTILHEQLDEWDWNPSMNTAFQHLKAWICQTLLNATLTYYDRSKPVIVQTDTSEYGLGAALIQSGCPIPFTSKTLTDIETHYVNI